MKQVRFNEPNTGYTQFRNTCRDNKYPAVIVDIIINYQGIVAKLINYHHVVKGLQVKVVGVV
jgi:hypothetical protein